jgi:hypothetical protein
MTRFAAILILPLIAAPASARACGMAPAPEKPATLVLFTRVGGVAGLNDRVTVRADGSATVEHGFLFPRHPRVDVVLTDTDRRALLSDLDGAGFTRLAESSGTPPFPDAFEYTITYQGHTVRRSDADRLGGLAPAIHRLTGLLEAR